MAGTALSYDRWLLLEHPGPWEYDALGGLGLAPAVLDPLVAAVRETHTRTLLVRRPGRVDRSAPRRWHLVDRTTGRTRTGGWDADRDLRAAVEAVRSTSDRDDAEPPRAHLLVCAHGRHDTCCAVEGRPVAAALAERWPAETWECTHVGGCRFAPSLLVLPDGSWYGGLDPAGSVDVVAAHLAGRVDPAYLRGFTGQPPVVQVAAVEAHRVLGPGAADAVRGHSIERIGDHRWLVDLRCGGVLPDRVRAVVVGRRRPAAFLTCRAHVPTRAWEWEVVELDTDPSPSPSDPSG